MMMTEEQNWWVTPEFAPAATVAADGNLMSSLEETSLASLHFWQADDTMKRLANVEHNLSRAEEELVNPGAMLDAMLESVCELAECSEETYSVAYSAIDDDAMSVDECSAEVLGDMWDMLPEMSECQATSYSMYTSTTYSSRKRRSPTQDSHDDCVSYSNSHLFGPDAMRSCDTNATAF